MSFRKPFKAMPVVLGEYQRARRSRRRRKQHVGVAAKTGGLALLVFAAGMVFTHAPKLPVYYRNCAAARAAGVAPIRRGEPGYRKFLDADDDGVACEPYRAD